MFNKNNELRTTQKSQLSILFPLKILRNTKQKCYERERGRMKSRFHWCVWGSLGERCDEKADSWGPVNKSSQLSILLSQPSREQALQTVYGN
jgi:hypothetical protein